MIRTSVQSSNISALAWANDTLYISFHTGDIYAYSDVPIEIYTTAVEEESVGRFFHKNIKGCYPYQKLSSDQIAELGLCGVALS
jgi:hypothetical protein